MNSTPSTTPNRRMVVECRLGPRAVAALATLSILQVGLGARAANPIDSLSTQIWVAAMWGGWAISVWILVKQPLRPTRVIGLGVMLSWHCLLMSVVREAVPERYFIMFGSYGLLQVFAATMLQLPNWRLWNERPAKSRKPLQFNILGIIVVTTMVALLITVMQRYSQAGDQFLVGTTFLNCLMVSVAAVAMTGSRMKLAGFAIFPLVTAMAVAAAWLAAWSEGEPSVSHFHQMWIAYGTIITVFGWLVWCAGLCGRLDAVASPDGIESR